MKNWCHNSIMRKTPNSSKRPLLWSDLASTRLMPFSRRKLSWPIRLLTFRWPSSWAFSNKVRLWRKTNHSWKKSTTDNNNREWRSKDSRSDCRRRSWINAKRRNMVEAQEIRMAATWSKTEWMRKEVEKVCKGNQMLLTTNSGRVFLRVSRMWMYRCRQMVNEVYKGRMLTT